MKNLRILISKAGVQSLCILVGGLCDRRGAVVQGETGVRGSRKNLLRRKHFLMEENLVIKSDYIYFVMAGRGKFTRNFKKEVI